MVEKIIHELLYPAKIIGKDYIKEDELVEHITNKIKTEKYKELVCNGKISLLLEKQDGYQPNGEKYLDIDRFFGYGSFLGITIIVPKFMRWDDSRIFLVKENEDMFVINIIN